MVVCKRCRVVFDRLNQGEYEDAGLGNTCNACIHIIEMSKLIVGKKIVSFRKMTSVEREAEGWERGTFVIQLEDGTLIYPSQDDEGNDSGALFGKLPDGKQIMVGYQL